MIRTLLADLSAALGLLTRLPTGWLPQHDSAAGFARSVWAYPFVGFGIGAAGGAVLAGGLALGLPPMVAALWSLAATLLLTGGLHEDGLADTADGFGGGRGRERKLAIMRDSRIGSYGVLALVLALGLRAALLPALGPGLLALAATCGAAASLGRGAILLLLGWLPPARADGMAASLARPPGPALLAGGALALLPAWLLLPDRAALAATLAAGGAVLLLGRLARRQIGGQTGDVLGAAVVVAEAVALTAVVATAG
jgi:adenosylcobinamide-GDP ribazoletransferase